MARSSYLIIGIFAVLLLVLFAAHASVANALLYFLLAGIIPGTNYALPPLAMFLLILVAFWLVVIRVWTIVGDTRRSYQEAQKVLERTHRMPRRRYQRG